MLNDSTITEALRNVQDPELHRDIVSLDMVKEIHVDGTAVALKIDLTTPACPLKDVIETDIEATNGVIHIIDGVLLPPAEMMDIVDTAIAAGSFNTLVSAVQAVARGEKYLSPAVTGLVVSQYVELLARVHAGGRLENLTEQEQEFLLRIGEGCSGEDLLVVLGVEEATVTSLQECVQAKLGLSGTAELIEYAGAQKWFAGHQGIEEALARAVASRKAPARPRQPQPLVEPLTNRELDALSLLADRLYNKEIADQLGISVETVKSHLKQIFQKLEVSNRVEAVAKAREIGLLD